MDSTMITTYIGIFIILFAGAFVQGIVGFGSAMVWMSFLPLVIAFTDAASIVPLMLTILGGYMTIRLFKYVQWKTAIIPLVVSLICTSIGVWIMAFTTVQTMQIVLGIFLFLIGVYFFVTSKNPIVIKPTPLNGGIAGMIAGTFTGLLNIGGPPLAIYYSQATDEPLQFKGCLEFNFLVMYGWAAIMKGFQGVYTAELLTFLIPATAGLLGGSLIGLKLFGKFDKKIVSRLVWTMLVIMGLFQLGKAFKLF
ncbi:MAG: sulfite exporter TauE/SafE family protein [Eubacteriaceae bacterium]|nr:sulfite exporter TauE/SafE family protein [Eubacteriaceae bacterium]